MSDWSKITDSLASGIDSSIKNNDLDSLTSFCGEIKKLISDVSDTPESVKSILIYYLANIYQHLGAHDGNGWSNGNYGKAIICHRKFYRYKGRVDAILPQVEVNHANTLETLCRLFEAIPLWKKGTLHNGDAEEVGLYRLANGLLWLSNHLYDKEHTHYYQLYAYSYVKKLQTKNIICHEGIRDNVRSDSSSTIGRFLRHIQNTAFESDLDLSLHSYSPNYSKEEKKYRAWCKDNILFVNPLNDLEAAWVVDHDVLNFPTYSTPVSEGPYLAASFSAIKNEYCYYRHLFYEGVNKKYAKFTDNGKYLTDTLDGVIYEGNIEKIKNALKGCFSVLDKISRLLDKYYELGSKNIAFNRQWFDREEKLKDRQNPFITALFWLSKDFSQHDDDQRRPSYWLDDSAFEVRELRNELEHGWVRVINTGHESCGHRRKGHDYAYTITSSDLTDKGIYVLKQTRNALMYFCLAVNFTEKFNKNDDKSITLKSDVPLI